MKNPSVNTYQGPQSMSGAEYLMLDMLMVKEAEERKRTCLLTENPALGKQKGDRAMGFSALKRSLSRARGALTWDIQQHCPLQ